MRSQKAHTGSAFFAPSFFRPFFPLPRRDSRQQATGIRGQPSAISNQGSAFFFT
ncbi:hypothetical protein ABBQ38_000022 [Trebouxia sp. C0009 RCD-2024]